MAEIAIPLLGLGAMYIISNNKKSNIEEMTNYQEETNKKSKPIKQTFPVPVETKTEANFNSYSNPNNSKNQYFNKKYHQKELKNNSGQFMSLTGESMNSGSLTHNNMQPYFGSKVRQANVSKRHESVLDNMIGTGSQELKKKARAPLFKPEKSLTWTHGAPNQTDFYRSRINPSKHISNVKPFEEQRVGPGLNQGYTTEGFGGFNSGMHERDTWKPKNVDDLRVATNPKNSYKLTNHEGPAMSKIINRGVLGKVEKHLPDTFYHNTPDRWFTTTGAEKAPRVISEEPLQYQNRPETTKEHFGTGGRHENEAARAPENYLPAKKVQNNALPIKSASATGTWTDLKVNYGRQGYKTYANNRTTTKHDHEMGVVSRGIWAVVSPILDVLRPTRKENVIGAFRKTGNASGHDGGAVWNPADRTKTTIREQTENTKHNSQPSKDYGGGYYTNPHQAIDNNRQSTSVSYTANASAASYANKPTTYNSAYNAHLNPNKEIISKSRLNHGSTNKFNSHQNIKISKIGINNEAQMYPSMPVKTLSPQQYGVISGKHTREISNVQRNQPELLKAFNQNEFAQPLNSWA